MKSKVFAILVNDIHVDKSNTELIKDIFSQIISLCKKYDTNKVVCGGDVFTNRSGQPLICLTTFGDVLNNLDENGIKFYSIPGNHDKTDGNSLCSYLDIFSSYKNFYLARQGVGNFIGNDKVSISFVPYFKDDDVYIFHLEAARSETKHNVNNFLITHIGINGVRNNDGSEINTSVRQFLFNDWDKVLVGHYHNASKLGKNIYYTGSAYQNNFGENVIDKGVTLIFENGDIKFVPLNFPRYIQETVDVNDKESLHNLLEKYDGEDYNHIRFVFKGTRVDCQKINISDIQDKYGIDCKVVCDENIDAINSSEDAVIEFDSSSIRKAFVKYCADNSINGNKLKYGLELIKKIQ